MAKSNLFEFNIHYLTLFNFYLLLFVYCVCMCMNVYHSAIVKVRGQLLDVSSLLPLRGSCGVKLRGVGLAASAFPQRANPVSHDFSLTESAALAIFNVCVTCSHCGVQ